MALRVDEVLAVWREAERVLDDLPPGDPERRLISAHVVEIRSIYRRLTDAMDTSYEGLGSSRDQLESATATLHRVRASLARDAK